MFTSADYDRVKNVPASVRFERMDRDDVINLGRALRLTSIVVETIAEEILGDLMRQVPRMRCEKPDLALLVKTTLGELDACWRAEPPEVIKLAVLRDRAESVAAALEFILADETDPAGDLRECLAMIDCEFEFESEDRRHLWAAPAPAEPPTYLETRLVTLQLPDGWWCVPLLIGSVLADAARWTDLDDRLREELIVRMLFIGTTTEQAAILPEPLRSDFTRANDWHRTVLGF